MKERTKAFGIRIIKLTESLPRTRAAEIIGRQLLRSAVSVGANYRSACRAKSRADFISKLSIVEEEADESLYWLELLCDCKITVPENVRSLMIEADELTALIVASIKTARLGKQ